ncbi:DegT/DnrJ/EryC1/StrS aminotransferase family protein [Salinimonas sp. HHU 13199]|uniref:DegT/DnrJ/EryC1/StrS aminotransferase family protein n=1 Tax=Salinimonas profundi TaxID=2729140 RepID=A0ABR8LK94_9ALTE|nr:DegT/DnrJ/EryC1/StrS family aminotransferase [Salinimonas profundi]MBD3586622.1 DegT/DnrJ/EryC1/StrS aminotransferase family protein [Salinimonas profundi]
MKWSQLAPVGTRVLPRSRDYLPSPLTFSGFDYSLVNSGTAALGAILAWYRKQHDAGQALTAVIPGYTCPDLVAACVYAGVTPVIVDLTADRYQLNNEHIAQLDKKPDIIICPALFGMSMDLAQIRALVGDETLIIEDNAQWFPEVSVTSSLVSLKQYALPAHTHQADFFITSFGRGKPVNLMGGGLVAWNTARVSSFEPDIAPAPQSSSMFDIKRRLFNTVCRPGFYGAISRFPGLNLGATVYHPLHEVHAMDAIRQERLTASILAYLRQPVHIQTMLQQAVTPLWAPQSTQCRLLRFPILTQSKQARNHLLRIFNEAGLGASAMYGEPLYDIDGVASDCQAPFSTPVSKLIAERLLTLPLHHHVKKHHVHRMVTILDDNRQWLADAPPNQD